MFFRFILQFQSLNLKTNFFLFLKLCLACCYSSEHLFSFCLIVVSRAHRFRINCASNWQIKTPGYILLLLLSASPYSGSPQRDSNLHFTWSTSSPFLVLTLSMSSLTKSIHLLLGLPLFLLPGTAISIILFPT